MIGFKLALSGLCGFPDVFDEVAMKHPVLWNPTSYVLITPFMVFSVTYVICEGLKLDV